MMAVGVKSFERQVIEYLEDESLPALSRYGLGVAYVAQQAQSKALEQALKRWHRRHEASCRLAEVPGIGVHTATALVATLGDGRSFRHGRQGAALIGLVPRQAGSGGKHWLPGISKRGDGLLRRLWVQGAQSVLRHVRRRQRAGLPSGQPRLQALLKRKHPNQVAMALANKMARIAWGCWRVNNATVPPLPGQPSHRGIHPPFHLRCNKIPIAIQVGTNAGQTRAISRQSIERGREQEFV